MIDRVWPWLPRLLGLGILVYETIAEHADRPSLITAAVALILGPTFVKFDRKP